MLRVIYENVGAGPAIDVRFWALHRGELASDGDIVPVQARTWAEMSAGG